MIVTINLEEIIYNPIVMLSPLIILAILKSKRNLTISN